MLAPRRTLHSTPLSVLEEAFKAVSIKKSDVLYDIGCGDGRCVIFAAKTYGISCVGIEIDPVRAEEARKRVHEAGVDHLVRIECGNALNIDVSSATVVFLFLIERGLRLILPKLQAIPHSIRVITYLYPFATVEPEKKQFCPIQSGASFPYYFYRFDQ